MLRKLTSNLVSVNWLKSHLNDENLIILDCTIPKVSSIENTEGKLEVIPNTLFFDIKNKFSDVLAPFPNTIPSEAQFQTSVKELGINNDSLIVVYDRLGIYSSPRAWWLFQTFGFENVYVLNGGLPEWKKQGFTTNSVYVQPKQKGDFIAKINSSKVVFFNTIKAVYKDKASSIIDARSANRFNGKAPEPRKGLRSGTIPNSLNLPFNLILENGLLKSKKELLKIFLEITNNQQLVFTCGSGITAAILDLAATEIGYKNTKVYDGSWTEYGTLVK